MNKLRLNPCRWKAVCGYLALTATISFTTPQAYGFVDDPTAEPEEFVRQVFTHLSQSYNNLPPFEYDYLYRIESNGGANTGNFSHSRSYINEGNGFIKRAGVRFFGESTSMRRDLITGKEEFTHSRGVFTDSIAARWIVGTLTVQAFESQGAQNRGAYAKDLLLACRVGDPFLYGFNDGRQRNLLELLDRLDQQPGIYWKVRKSGSDEPTGWVLELWGASHLAAASGDMLRGFYIVDPDKSYLIKHIESFHLNGETARRTTINLTMDALLEFWRPSVVREVRLNPDGDSVKRSIYCEIQRTRALNPADGDHFSIDALDLADGTIIMREGNDGLSYREEVRGGVVINSEADRTPARSIALGQTSSKSSVQSFFQSDDQSSGSGNNNSIFILVSILAPALAVAVLVFLSFKRRTKF